MINSLTADQRKIQIDSIVRLLESGRKIDEAINRLRDIGFDQSLIDSLISEVNAKQITLSSKTIPNKLFLPIILSILGGIVGSLPYLFLSYTFSTYTFYLIPCIGVMNSNMFFWKNRNYHYLRNRLIVLSINFLVYLFSALLLTILLASKMHLHFGIISLIHFYVQEIYVVPEILFLIISLLTSSVGIPRFFINRYRKRRVIIIP
jgi:hypothetical protein